ncbi:MAG: phosphohistidine phosphatase SixA [Acidobacteria bacterium]|nr:MAG: phosphohistidine phosphatase SixA [Acidobacteriota bacterium]
MIVYFVRHASAGQKRFSPKKDEKRSLDAEGVHQCTQMGRILSAMEVAVDAVISSPLKRATQTASLIANEIGHEGKLNIENALRPEAKYEHFREMLRKYSKFEALVLVGHNPNFSEFLGRMMVANGDRAYVDLKKAAIAKVESEQKKFVLHWLLTPRLAKASADASVSEGSSGQIAISQNGSGPGQDIPAEGKKGKKKKKKQLQAARTSRSRPTTSRK